MVLKCSAVCLIFGPLKNLLPFIRLFFIIFIFDYFLNILSFKKKLKYFLKSKEKYLENLKNTTTYFIYFYISIENFIKYSSISNTNKNSNEKYCYKIVNNFYFILNIKVIVSILFQTLGYSGYTITFIDGKSHDRRKCLVFTH